MLLEPNLGKSCPTGRPSAECDRINRAPVYDLLNVIDERSWKGSLREHAFDAAASYERHALDLGLRLEDSRFLISDVVKLLSFRVPG